MRSKVEIQNEWLAWLEARAVSESLTFGQKVHLKVVLAQEVEWMIKVQDFETNLQKRLDKTALLETAHEGDLSAFDQDWVARKAFLQWMQT